MNERISAPPFPAPGPRIVVVGATSSGKTTTAARLAGLLSIPHIELDGLMWGPNWTQPPKDVFLERVRQAVNRPAWVVDGNYSETRPITWGQATTLVWLDYSLPVIFWQLTRRTLRRIFTRELLWGVNRETVRGAFFDRDSLHLYVIPSRKRQRQNYPRALRQEYPHLQVIHLRTPGETRAWLDRLAAQPPVKREAETDHD